jgi:hypothetical protein
MLRKPLALPLLASSLLLGASGALAAESAEPAQTTVAELVSMTGEITALDAGSRSITIRGPLGGELEAEVDEAVKNLGQVKVGDMITVAYYQSIAVSATRKGEANPLFVGGDATTAAPGEKPVATVSKQKKETVTVVSVDAKKRSVVFQGADGTLFPVEVKRPEFIEKLKNLKEGDQLDIVTTEAVITGVTPAGKGEKPSVAYAASTLVVDKGEVLRRVGNTLFIKNNAGRIVKVAVDPDYKFMLNGKEATVADVQPGTRLSRTAFRITEAAAFEAE